MSDDYTYWEKLDIMLMNDPYHQPTTVLGSLVKQPVDYASKSYNSWMGGGSPGGTSTGGSYTGSSSGEGVVDGLIAGLVAMGLWFVEHIWPLRVLKNAGLWLADSSRIWKLNAPFSILGAFFLVGMTTGLEAAWPGVGALATAVAGSYSPLLLFGIGAVGGWFMVPVFGMILALTMVFIGLAIALALIWGVLYLGWHLIATAG